MVQLRRPDNELRIEIMPMIDVIFLLLTFFIYAMVLMVRAELLPVQLEQYMAGEQATPRPAQTISISLDGSIHFNRQPTQIDAILERITEAQADEPETVIYLALEAGQGSVDRGPILTAIWDRLKDAGLEIHFVGKPGDSTP